MKKRGRGQNIRGENVISDYMDCCRKGKAKKQQKNPTSPLREWETWFRDHNKPNPSLEPFNYWILNCWWHPVAFLFSHVALYEATGCGGSKLESPEGKEGTRLVMGLWALYWSSAVFTKYMHVYTVAGRVCVWGWGNSELAFASGYVGHRHLVLRDLIALCPVLSKENCFKYLYLSGYSEAAREHCPFNEVFNFVVSVCKPTMCKIILRIILVSFSGAFVDVVSSCNVYECSHSGAKQYVISWGIMHSSQPVSLILNGSGGRRADFSPVHIIVSIEQWFSARVCHIFWGVPLGVRRCGEISR